MKNTYLIFFILCYLASNQISAQTYPFYDDFESYPAFQIPSAYPGNIQVRLVHGTNSSQGLGSFMNTFTTKDSATSPLIGPLTVSSGFSFDWRIVATIGSVFVPANLVAGDVFTASISTDGINYQEVLHIDNSNYVPSSDFNHFTFDLSGIASATINVKFNISRINNPDDFYVDIDNLSVSDTSVNTGINQKGLSEQTIYPNPVADRLLLPFNFQSDRSKMARITDEKGAMIQSISAYDLQQNNIDVSDLKTGLYYLSIEGMATIPFFKY